MQRIRKQFNYFENLEKKIKSALAIYLVVFVIGTIMTVLGIRNVLTFADAHILLFAVSVFIFALFAFIGLSAVIGKIDWLGELHINLDKKFFGFLERSNETIFRTLTSVLTSKERVHFQDLSQEKKGSIAQMIFSQLSDDSNNLFDNLMNSGIFKNWIWYWISIYGTFAFSLLTISSFAAAWLELALFSKPFFALIWILALTHLFVSIYIGKFLVEKTRRTVQGIVDAHQMDIVNVLIDRIQRQVDESRSEDFQYEGSKA